jgi:hypothetical protein
MSPAAGDGLLGVEKLQRVMHADHLEPEFTERSVNNVRRRLGR